MELRSVLLEEPESKEMPPPLELEAPVELMSVLLELEYISMPALLLAVPVELMIVLLLLVAR